MNFNKKILTLFVLVVLNSMGCFGQFKKVCYFTNWAQSRPTGGEFYPEDINPDLCTHIIYAFAKIENYNLAHTEDVDIGFDSGPGFYERIMVLKLLNPSLKILLAVGGWAQGSVGFDSVVASDDTLNRFAKNSIEFLRKWNFDGLDVDWEFPVVKKVEFTKLLQKLRIAFDNEQVTKDDRLELSIAVSGGQGTIDTAYEVDKISKYVDFVNLMAYDFHGSWSSKTEYHSALYPKVTDETWENTLNADWAVKYWIQKGCPKEKLILGLAFYGRGFKSSSSNVGSPSMGSSKAGKFTGEDGVLSFYEVCQIMKEKSLVARYDSVRGGAGLQNGGEWIGFENKESITQKARYIKDKCLGGSMVWTVDFDDFKGKYCGQGLYPLLNAIDQELKDSKCFGSISSTKKSQVTTVSKTTTPRPTETTTTTTTTTITTEPTTNSNNLCEGKKFIRSPKGCEYLQVCLKGFDAPVSTIKCPNGFWFDVDQATCVADKPYYCKSASTKSAITFTKKSTTVSTETTTDTTTEITTDFSTDTTTDTTPETTSDSHDWTESTSKPTNRRKFTTTTTIDYQPSTFYPETTNGNEYVNFACPEASGLFPNAQNCRRFWHCSNFFAYDKECPGNLVFDQGLKICTWSSDTCKQLLRDIIVPNKLYQIENSFECPQPDGLFQNDKNCKSFWHCSNGVAQLKDCPGNLFFNQQIGNCDYKSSCTERSI